MSITGAIVLYSVIWFMVFFIVLPIRFVSQDEDGAVVPGTPRSAPADAMVGKKAKITTLVGTLIWAAAAAFILWGPVSIKNVDIFHMMTPPAGQ